MKKEQPTQRPRGRPRVFDREQALEVAMQLFWLRGYEATSVAELSEAMGVNPPSLYAAFGDKKRLFAEAIQRYLTGPGSFGEGAFTAPVSARDAIADLLARAAEAYTAPGHPRGCMVIHSGQNCTAGDADVVAHLAGIRGSAEQALRSRIESGARAGELPPGTDPAELAAFYAAVIQGMSTKARDGATAEQLRAVARRAMAAWPA